VTIVPLDWVALFPDIAARRSALQAHSPEACRLYSGMVTGFFSALVKLSLTQRKSISHSSQRMDGTHGSATWTYGVSEVTGKGQLHLHVIGGCSEMEPTFVQRYAHDVAYQTAVSEMVVSHIRTEISEPVYTADRARRQAQLPPARPGLVQPPLAVDGSFVQRVDSVLAVVNQHEHMFRSCAGKRAHPDPRLIKCRFAYARPLQPESTFHQLFQQPTDPETGVYLVGSKAVEAPSSLPWPEGWPKEGSDPEEQCLPPRDPRTIAVELQRTQPWDRYVVANGFLEVLLLRCNGDRQVAVSAAAAICMLVYLCVYLKKEYLGLHNALSMVWAAVKGAEAYPSIAADTGTPVRNAQFLINKLLNGISGLEEKSEQQAVMQLLGQPSEYSSHTFWYLYVQKFAAAQVEAQIAADLAAAEAAGGSASDVEQPDMIEDSDLEDQELDLVSIALAPAGADVGVAPLADPLDPLALAPACGDFDPTLAELADHLDPLLLHRPDDGAGSDSDQEGVMEIVRGSAGVVVVDQVTHCKFRGKELRFMSPDRKSVV